MSNGVWAPFLREGEEKRKTQLWILLRRHGGDPSSLEVIRRRIQVRLPMCSEPFPPIVVMTDQADPGPCLSIHLRRCPRTYLFSTVVGTSGLFFLYIPRPCCPRTCLFSTVVEAFGRLFSMVAEAFGPFLTWIPCDPTTYLFSTLIGTFGPFALIFSPMPRCPRTFLVPIVIGTLCFSLSKDVPLFPRTFLLPQLVHPRSPLVSIWIPVVKRTIPYTVDKRNA